MSAYKKLNSQDAFVSTYVAKKNWIITGSSFADHNIQAFGALSGSSVIDNVLELSIYGPLDSLITGQGVQRQELVHRSLKQLYYSDYNNTNGSLLNDNYYKEAIKGTSVLSAASSSLKLFDHYEQSSLTPVQGTNGDASGSRYLNQFAMVYSLPRDIIGTHIEPNTFKMFPASNVAIENAIGLYTATNYAVADYFKEVDGWEGYLGGLSAIVDDGEGNLKLLTGAVTRNVGNIFYSHGIIVLTELDVAYYFRSRPGINTVAYKSNQPIYTYNYHVKVSDYELNHTLNPSALTGTDNRLKDNVSGSSFQPYITSVGLYNDGNELIAVGKLSQPLTKPADTELTIQVKLDI